VELSGALSGAGWNPKRGFGFTPGISRNGKAGPTVNPRVLYMCALSLGILALAPMGGEAQAPSAEAQIAAALQAAPEGQQEGATVLGFDDAGQIVTLRAGTNELVCLGDNPTDTRFSVACYHESLEPYMARGRELARDGVTDGTERNQIRWREAEAGTLAMPELPATLYVMTGAGFDPASGEVEGAYLRYVLYTPWATVESTGLTDSPQGPGSPWLMYPGTAGAHIMISPPASSPGG
jgi:hypothetical protein